MRNICFSPKNLKHGFFLVVIGTFLNTDLLIADDDPLDSYHNGVTLFVPAGKTVSILDKNGAPYTLVGGDAIQIVGPPEGRGASGPANWAYEVRVVDSTAEALTGKNFFTSKKNFYKMNTEPGAQTAPLVPSTNTDSAHCLPPPPGFNANIDKQIAEQEKKLLSTQYANVPPITSLPAMNDSKVMNDKCKNLIDDKGVVGPWGARLLEAMDTVDRGMDKLNTTEDKGEFMRGADFDLPGRSCFYDQIDMTPACPKFNTFSMERKKQVYLFMFAALAQKESSCNPKEQGQGVNGLADGLFQLEYSRALRDGSGRPRDYCKTNSSVDSQDLTFQFNCTAATLHMVNCTGGYSDINTTKGYWHKLRGNRWVIQKTKTFPGCV